MLSRPISFTEYLSQKEDSNKDDNVILDNIDRKRLSDFRGFGKKIKNGPTLNLTNNFDVNYSMKNEKEEDFDNLSKSELTGRTRKRKVKGLFRRKQAEDYPKEQALEEEPVTWKSDGSVAKTGSGWRQVH